MAWPQLDDYRTAIQNTSMCFDDPDLKNGIVSVDRLGLPKVSSGNFACVYEVKSGGQRWAVRVFNKEVTDQQVRYDQISNHLAAVLPPYMVSFKFITRGIMVRGNWYPIVKMGWAEGVPLTQWVWKNQVNPNALLQLASKWRFMVGALRGLDVSHSDLQQDNVLINPAGDIKLVDYDCMFVPAMRGQSAPELGHPNWNHSQRSAQTFDSFLDQFPGLVGYLSLLAVAEDSGLMNRYCNDENIIFKKDDFQDPDQSPVLKELRKSSNSAIRQLADSLSDWCKQQVDRSTLEAVCGGASAPAPMRYKPSSGRTVKTHKRKINHTNNIPTKPTVTRKKGESLFIKSREWVLSLKQILKPIGELNESIPRSDYKTIDNVQFTVYRPDVVCPQEWYDMLAFAHLSENETLQKVHFQADKMLGDQEREYRSITQDSEKPISHGAKLTFIPKMEGIEFNPTAYSFNFSEDLHLGRFRLRASADMDGKTVYGKLTVYLECLIVAQLSLHMKVDHNYSKRRVSDTLKKEKASFYGNVFVSYSHDDRAVVDRLQRLAPVFGKKYFRDSSDLLPGENWRIRIPQLIREADIFQLFWSTNSMRSENVLEEIKYALSLKGPELIWGVYWEEPFPRDTQVGLPPEELANANFQLIRW
jgi:hypothetical protein